MSVTPLPRGPEDEQRERPPRRSPAPDALLHLVGYDHGPEMEAREAVYSR